ncbi:hypothetical protein IEO21_03627 [Rhodonia placenta]|uniref:Uncharacterized protein n=1 Tax=Rhodonia placenta TaxID=104341 RepID=A0A8H7P579_9APHY|nr:hypothetical protein IEO21_03627 [Postia placenta]
MLDDSVHVRCPAEEANCSLKVGGGCACPAGILHAGSSSYMGVQQSQFTFHLSSPETAFPCCAIPMTTPTPTLMARAPVVMQSTVFINSTASSSEVPSVIRTTMYTSASSTPVSLHSALGPLLGGLLGGFFGLMIIVTMLWCLWHRRHDIFHRTDSLENAPEIDHKHSEQWYRRPSAPPSPTPTPQPYQYGVIGRPQSTTSGSSGPHSRSHSPSVLTMYSPPPSASMHFTPVPGSSTAISPGPSLASSSRASTPGLYPLGLQQYRYELQQQQTQQYQQQARVSWPRYGGSEDGNDGRRSPVLRPRSERRPSRLSLTLANWNPETDGDLEAMREGENGERDGLGENATSASADASARDTSEADETLDAGTRETSGLGSSAPTT